MDEKVEDELLNVGRTKSGSLLGAGPCARRITCSPWTFTSSWGSAVSERSSEPRLRTLPCPAPTSELRRGSAAGEGLHHPGATAAPLPPLLPWKQNPSVCQQSIPQPGHQSGTAREKGARGASSSPAALQKLPTGSPLPLSFTFTGIKHTNSRCFGQAEGVDGEAALVQKAGRSHTVKRKLSHNRLR